MGARSAECAAPNPPTGVLAKANHPAPYRPRRPRETPFYKLVDEHFDEFEELYPARYQAEFRFGCARDPFADSLDKPVVELGNLAELLEFRVQS